MARSILTKKLLGKRSQAQVCRDVMAKARRQKRPQILIIDENERQVFTDSVVIIRSSTPLLDATSANENKNVLAVVEHTLPKPGVFRYDSCYRFSWKDEIVEAIRMWEEMDGDKPLSPLYPIGDHFFNALYLLDMRELFPTAIEIYLMPLSDRVKMLYASDLNVEMVLLPVKVKKIG